MVGRQSQFVEVVTPSASGDGVRYCDNAGISGYHGTVAIQQIAGFLYRIVSKLFRWSQIVLQYERQ